MRSYYSTDIKEEELKNNVAQDWFADYDAKRIIGNIDFSVAVRRDKSQQYLTEPEYLLWAEAKRGTWHDVYQSFVQLILTIGKERTFDHHLPPKFLGAFDAEKMAFLPYSSVMEVFAQNDFNWNATPSDHSTKEFLQLYNMVRRTLDNGTFMFRYLEHGKELARFIKRNFRLGDTISTIQINKNNFTHIYLKWVREVKPSICINWDEAKKEGLLDADFYLADILSQDNKTIKEKLYVLLETNKYRYNIHRKATGALSFDAVEFNDGQKAHTQFWKRYTRPPKEEYWDYIVDRRDLLVPQDIRERKGSFYTPSRWVELSQEYIARELGEDWQDEYYVWDCCAGTGNLLAGLTNKWNIFASTLDKQDVRVMHDLIESNRLNLLPNHVFQFDFLNDDFKELPEALHNIINDPEKRRKLVIYINPPYAEAASTKQISGTGQVKTNVARNNIVEQKYRKQLGNAVNELFAQFFIRIYEEIPDCILAEFSKLKILQSPYFREFRNVFQARLGHSFVVPAATFDNVKGSFPIGFFIWRTEEKETFSETSTDVYDKDGKQIGTKNIYAYKDMKLLTDWMKTAHDKVNPRLAYLRMLGSDVQHSINVFLTTTPYNTDLVQKKLCNITEKNIVERLVYFAVRQCIEATWLNDRDQFLWPKDTWQEDKEFQSDCLAYALLHGQNRISSAGGTNHWIPFTEDEVDAKERFESHFMSDYINGKHRHKPKVAKAAQGNLFAAATEAETKTKETQTAITFSPEARAVMDAGRELWRYYHSQPKANPNASFYDIRLHFQGTNDKGKMNPDSPDERYTKLIKTLRTRLSTLAKKLEPKVYEHGFLMR